MMVPSIVMVLVKQPIRHFATRIQAIHGYISSTKALKLAEIGDQPFYVVDSALDEYLSGSTTGFPAYTMVWYVYGYRAQLSDLNRIPYFAGLSGLYCLHDHGVRIEYSVFANFSLHLSKIFLMAANQLCCHISSRLSTSWTMPMRK